MILILDAKRRLSLPASLVPAQPGDNSEAVVDPEEDAVIFRRLSNNTNWLKNPQELSGEDGRSVAAEARVSQTPQVVSWLLDSDVLSQPAKKAGDARVISWLERHQDQCYTSSIVVAKLAIWVRTKRGKQRMALQKWLTDLIEAVHGRILGFNVSTAHVWAEQQHQFQAAGKPMPVEDSYIASIARRHNLTVATENVKDFQRPGVSVFDPFKKTM